MTPPVSGRPSRRSRPSARPTPRSPRRPTTRRDPESSLSAMRTWTAQTTVNGRPEDVLAVLTDPAACGRWAPIDFEGEDLDSKRLETGSKARVVGRLAGQRAGFDVDVHAAESSRFELTASGPIVLDVAYDVEPS